MKIAYITAQVPQGRGEPLIIDEILVMKEAGADPVIMSRNPAREGFHQESRILLEGAAKLPLISNLAHSGQIGLVRAFAAYVVNLLFHNAGPFVGDPVNWYFIGLALAIDKVVGRRKSNDHET